jgi:hypothetical protein
MKNDAVIIMLSTSNADHQHSGGQSRDQVRDHRLPQYSPEKWLCLGKYDNALLTMMEYGYI